MEIANERALYQTRTSVDFGEGAATQTSKFGLSKIISADRLTKAKWAFSTRRIPNSVPKRLLAGDFSPSAGDLILAKVVGLGQHKRLELPDGRRAHMFLGDEIVVCYGNRYAPNQFEAVVPDGLEECDLVAAGGLAATTLSRNGAINAATRLQPLGLLADENGCRINAFQWRLPTTTATPAMLPPVIAVAGTSMDSGKTTSAAALIRGLRDAGLRVGAAKLTGTGAGGDLWHMADAGAAATLDFTDAGFVSTYKVSPEALTGIMNSLLAELLKIEPDVIVLEVADGLLQAETATLLQSPAFKAAVDGIIFAAGEVMAATAGVAWLREKGLNVLGVSGVLTRAPLCIQEAESVLDIPVLTISDLVDGALVPRIISREVPDHAA